jgi:hypothetical protein
MKAVKIAAIVFFAYVGVVAVFESLLGILQPSNASTIVITTLGADGAAKDRVVSPIEDGGQLYVSANHWPRSWYKRALANPDVYVTAGDEKKSYRAVPITGAEHDRLSIDHAHGIGFRILTGFPPRYFLRLDPR